MIRLVVLRALKSNSANQATKKLIVNTFLPCAQPQCFSHKTHCHRQQIDNFVGQPNLSATPALIFMGYGQKSAHIYPPICGRWMDGWKNVEFQETPRH